MRKKGEIEEMDNKLDIMSSQIDAIAEKVEVVIEIPTYYLAHPQDYSCLAECVRRGVQLPKGHGRLIDISKIDEDRVESDNPIIYLTMNGDYIEAISLDYLNNLPTIIEADKKGEKNEK